MVSVVLLAVRSPSKLAAELTLAGYRVFEVLAVSEALYLCETEHVDAIVIAADVEDPEVVEAQPHHLTIRLKPEASARDLIWELSKLFPGKAATIQ